MNRRAFCGAMGSLALGGLGPGRALAQEAFPVKPLRLIVPFAAGSDADAIARALADKLADNARWAVPVENEPGARGNLALEAVAKAAPDGYTLGLGHTSNLTVNPWLPAKMSIDPLVELSAVSQVTSQGLVLVVASASPIKALKNLLESARARPGTLRMGSAGAGTMSHLAGELLQNRASIRCRHVASGDGNAALKALAARRTDFCFANLAAVAPLLAQGSVRAVAVTSPKRLALLADVPAIAQTIPGFDATAWTGIVAPARLSKFRVFQINAEVQRALERKDMQELLAADGVVGVGGAPQNFGDYVRAEHIKWGALIKQSAFKVA